MAKKKIFLYYTRSGRKRYAAWRGLTLLGTSTNKRRLAKRIGIKTKKRR